MAAHATPGPADGPRSSAAAQPPVADPAPDAASPVAAEAAPEGMVTAGRVGRAHGLDGSFYVTRPRARLLDGADEVTIAGVLRQVERRTGTATKPLLRVAGIGDRSTLDAVRGAEIYVPRAQLPELPEDEYWPEDLVGIAVRSRAGASVGEVVAVRDLPSCDVLEVRRPDDSELLVPLIHDAVPDLDVGGRVAVVDLAFLGEDEPGASPVAEAG